MQLAYEGATLSGVLGLYAFDGDAGGLVRNNFLNSIFGTSGGTVYTRGRAAYTDWSWRLSSDWAVGAGLRFTDERKRAVVLNQSFKDASFSTVVATSADFDKTLEVQDSSPKLSLDYRWSDSTKLYGTASRGFKSGGYNIRANTLAVPASGNPFKDETLDSFELGSKMLLDQGRLELNAALFHNKYKNVQLSVFTSYTLPNGTPGFFGDFTNAGRAQVQGAELEFVWRPLRAWTLSGHLAALDAVYDEYLDRGVNVAEQKKFTNSPKFQGALNIEYRLSLASAGTLRLRLSASHRSRVYPTTDLSEAIAQDAFTLLSAGAILDIDKHWSLSLQGSNLTDKAYRTDGYNIASLSILNGYYGPPRVVTVGASYKF